MADEAEALKDELVAQHLRDHEYPALWPWLRLFIGLKVNKVWPFGGNVVIHGWREARRRWRVIRNRS